MLASRGDELVREVLRRAEKDRKEHSRIREGQALFNALHTIDSNLANAVVGTNLDPFYDDSRIPAFLGFLRGS